MAPTPVEVDQWRRGAFGTVWGVLRAHPRRRGWWIVVSNHFPFDVVAMGRREVEGMPLEKRTYFGDGNGHPGPQVRAPIPEHEGDEAMKTIIETVDLRGTSLEVELVETRMHRLAVDVEHASDRYRRVVVTWLGSGGQTKATLIGPTYLDLRTKERRTPAEQAAHTPEHMWAHTLHGADLRRLLDEGTVTR